MKKQLLLFAMILLPLVASANDIEVKNADGKTIYYNYINDGTELSVTFMGAKYNSYSNEYKGNVVIPEEVTYMNRTRKVTSIGNYAFWNCSGLTSITIPNSVTSIGDYAFYNCSGLTSITIPNSVTSIGGSAFYNCSGLKKVIVKDIAAWCGINFGSNPLSYAHHLYSDENTEITNLVIPNSVTSIGESAFHGCSGLTSITIPNSVTSIGDYAFSYCTGLTSVTIPNSVTSIGGSAFSQCYGLTSITIPNSVTSIGGSAFSQCSGLTSVTIGNSVTSIGDNAFNDCKGLRKVIVKNIAAWCGIKFNDYSSNISNPLYYAHHLYSDENTEITNLIIPNSVTSIGESAFHGCSGLTSVTIGNSVTSIGDEAFSGCSSLTSVTIPNSVTSIGDNAFSQCSGLTSATIGNSVTSIGYYAFYQCTNLTSITIGNSVTSIGNYAFEYCSGLRKVIVKDIAAWCGIEFGVSDSNPLSYAKHLYSDKDTEIKNLVIPNSVTSIEYSAFLGCIGLTSVSIPNSVTSIGGSAFNGCKGLTSVTIPNSVTSIGGSAFNGCKGLTSITIGSGIKYIYSFAFASCPDLTDVTCYAEYVPDTRTNAFKDSYIEDATLHVPASAVNAYKAADPWKNFKNIIEANPTGIKAIENTQSKNTTIYDLNGVRLSEPKKGINIINGKKVVIK